MKGFSEFDVQLKNTCEWLEHLEQFADKSNRLSRHEDELCEVIKHDLHVPRLLHCAVELLMKVFPYFGITLAHIEKWSPLLMDALIEVQYLKDNDLQMRLWRWVGEQYRERGQHKDALEAFETALERAEMGDIEPMIVVACTGLFKLQWFDLNRELNKDLVAYALATAQRIDEEALKADLHYALATVYSRLAETKTALGHAQMNYIYWNNLKNQAELGRAALRLAIIYRHAASCHDVPKCLDHAENFLEMAQSLISQTEYAWQYVMIAYEKGASHLQRKDYTVAQQWFMEAVRESNQLGLPQYTAIAYHGLGLAQTRTGEFDNARSNLRQAKTVWQKLDNVYEQGSLLQALGNLERLAGNFKQARQYLQEASEICDKLPTVAQQQVLRKLIDDTLNEME